MKPLTIEELRNLEVGDWVWIINLSDKESCYKQINDICEEEDWMWFEEDCQSSHYSDYDTEWIAYKNKEEAENANYGNIEQAVREFAEELKEIFKTKNAACFANVACNRIDNLIKERFGNES